MQCTFPSSAVRKSMASSGRRAALLAALLAGAVLAPALSDAATQTWSGATSTNWGTAANWGGTLPVNDLLSDTANFAAASYTNLPALTASYSVNTLTVVNTSGAVTITGPSMLTIGNGGLSVANAGGLTLNGPIGLGGPQTWLDSGAGNVAINGTISQINGGVVYLSKTGTGNFTTTLSNDASGILAPWIMWGTTSSPTFATVSGGVISAYAGATVISAGANLSTMTSSITNYDLSFNGSSTTSTALVANTIRDIYTAGDITYTFATGGSWTTNAVVNASTGHVMNIGNTGNPGNLLINAGGQLLIYTGSNYGTVVNVAIGVTGGGNGTLITAGAGTGGVNLNGNVTLGAGNLEQDGTGSTTTVNGTLTTTGDIIIAPGNGALTLQPASGTNTFGNIIHYGTGGLTFTGAGINGGDTAHSISLYKNPNLSGAKGDSPNIAKIINWVNATTSNYYTNAALENVTTTTFTGALTNGKLNITNNYAGNFVIGGTTDNTGFSLQASTGGFTQLSKTSSATVHAVGGTLTLQNMNAPQLGSWVKITGTGGDQIADTGTVTMNNTAYLFDFNGQSEGWNSVTGNGGVFTNMAPSTTSRMTVGLNNAGPTLASTIQDGAGVTSATMALAKAGTGTLLVSAGNNYSGGTFIQNGTLKVNAGGAAVNGVTVTPLGIKDVPISASFATGQTHIFVSPANAALLKTAWSVLGTGIPNGRTITAINTTTGDITLSGNTDAAVTSGNFTFGMPNQATVSSATGLAVGQNLLNGGYASGTAITYINGTTINLTSFNTPAVGLNGNAGTSVNFSAYQALPAGSVVTLGGASTNGTLDLNGFSQTVGGFTLDAAVTSGNYASNIITNTGGTNASLTVGSGNSAFAGKIQDGSKTVALVITGATQSLAGNNNYSGGTTVNSGVLGINSAAAIGTGSLIINGGVIDNASGSSLTLTSANAQTWASDFAFGGTNSLNLGTGAVGLGTNAGTTRTITVNGSSLTVGGVISNGTTVNSLTVAGAGTLVLTNGANALTGGVHVTTGHLSVSNAIGSGTGTGPVTIDSTGSLGGYGFIAPAGTNVVTISGTLAPSQGNATGTGTLTITPTSGGMTINSGVFNFNFGNSGNDCVQVNGPLTLTGKAMLNLSALLGFTPALTPSGTTYKLLSTTGGLTLPDSVNIGNDIIMGTNTGNSAFIYTFTATSTELDLNVKLPPAKDITWAGTAAAWDHSSNYWAGEATKFSNNDRVTFDNSGSGNQTIATTEVVSPSTWTVNSDHLAADYTINSTAGAISGFTGLDKYGSSYLTLVGANNFTGAVNIHAGKVSVSTLASLGDDSATNKLNLGDTTAATLQYTGSTTASTGRAVTVNVFGATIDTSLGSANASFSGVVGGSGDLNIVQGGISIFTLSNTANALTGSVTVSQGTLRAASLGNAAAGKSLTLGTGGSSANFTYTGVSFSEARNLILGPASTITVSNAATNLTLAGSVTGGALNVAGPGTLTVPGSVTLGGSSHSVTGGASLVLGAASNTVAGTLTIGSGSSVTAGTGTAVATSGALGSAAVTMAGGTLNLKAIGGAGGISGFSNAQFNGSTADSTFTTLTVLNGQPNGYASSTFDYNMQSVSTFVANFTYQGTGAADGITFCLQADPRQTSAIGDTGGKLGYGGTALTQITPSAAVAFDLYHGSRNGFGTGGAVNLPAENTSNTGSVVLGSNHPIAVSLIYDGTSLSETLTDTVTSATFTTSFVANLVSVLGQNSAYVGFTGGMQATSIQTVSNFSFGSPLVNYGNAVSVTANSTITSPVAVSGLGALTMTSGTTLTTSGLGVTFASTSFSGAGTYTFAPSAGGFVALGTATDGGTALTINNSGAGNLVLAGSTFTGVGTVISTSGTGNIAIIGNSVSSSPLGTAVVQIGTGGGVLIGADPSSSNVTIASPISFAGNGSVTAQGLLFGTSASATVNFGDATHGISIAAGKVISLSSSGSYVLNIAGPITGADATSGIAISGGNVTLSVANPSFTGVAAVNGGVLTLTTANALANASSIPVASGAMLVVNAPAVNLSAANILAGGILKLSQNQVGGTPPVGPILGTLSLDSDSAAGYNLTLGNGSSLQSTSYHTFYGNLSIAGTATFNSTISIQVNGTIGNGASSGSLVVSGTGSTLFLYGNTSLGGTVAVSKGTMTLYGTLTCAGGTTIGSANAATLWDNGNLAGTVNVVANGTLNAMTTANCLASATVTVPGGAVNVGVDNVLGAAGSITATNTGYVNISAAQSTHSPSLVIGTAANPGGGVFGNATNFVWAYNPTGSATVVPGKVELYDGATLGITAGTSPTRASLGVSSAVFYQGITNAYGSFGAGDDGITLYKGLAFGAWTPGSAGGALSFGGSITDTSTTGPGGTNLGIDVQMNGLAITIGSPAMLTTTDTAHGGIRFVGAGAVLTVNGWTSSTATPSTISRVGTAADQNTVIAALTNSNAVQAGYGFGIQNGRVTISAGDSVQGTLTVGSGGTLDFKNSTVTPTVGTYNIGAGSSVYIMNPAELLGGATFNFATGSQVVPGPGFFNATYNVPATVYGNADIVMSNNTIYTNGLRIGQGARITTAWGDGGVTIPVGGGIRAAVGATNVILSAAPGVGLTINDIVDFASTGTNLQIGDSSTYSTIHLWYNNDLARTSFVQSGTVSLSGASVAAQDVTVLSGTANISATAATFRDVTIGGGATTFSGTTDSGRDVNITAGSVAFNGVTNSFRNVAVTGGTVTALNANTKSFSAASLTVTGGTSFLVQNPDNFDVAGNIVLSSTGTNASALKLNGSSMAALANGTLTSGAGNAVAIGNGGLFFADFGVTPAVKPAAGAYNILQPFVISGAPLIDTNTFGAVASIRIDKDNDNGAYNYLRNVTLNTGAVFVVAGYASTMRADLTLAGAVTTGSKRNGDSTLSFDIGNMASAAPGSARTFNLGETTTQAAGAQQLTTGLYGNVTSDVTMNVVNAQLNVYVSATLNGATIVLGPAAGFTTSNVTFQPLAATTNFGGNFSAASGTTATITLPTNTVAAVAQVASLTFSDASLAVNQGALSSLQVMGNTTVNGTGAATLTGSGAVDLGTLTGSKTLTVNRTATTTAVIGAAFTGTLLQAGGSTVTISSVAGGYAYCTMAVTNGTLAITPDLFGGTLSYGGGTLALAAPVTHVANFNVTAGTYTMGTNVAVNNSTTVSGGKLVINTTTGAGALALNGGSAQIQSGLTNPTSAVIFPHLTLTSGALDITNNRVVIRSSTDITNTIRDAVIHSQLTTSVTAAPVSNLATTIGYLTGSDYNALSGSQPFGGVAVGPDDVVARWTYAGDTNLDGVIDLRDFRLMDAGYLTGFDGVSLIATWKNGDLDHNGIVNAADFGIAVANMNGTQLGGEMYTQYASEFGASFVQAYNAAVPEPTSLVVLGLGAVGLLIRRRK